MTRAAVPMRDLILQLTYAARITINYSNHDVLTVYEKRIVCLSLTNLESMSTLSIVYNQPPLVFSS